MNHADHHFFFHPQTLLFFHGVHLVKVQYIESVRTPGFSAHGFFDAEGTWWEIDVDEDEPSHQAAIDERLCARIAIDGQTIKVLEIWDGPGGRFFL